MCLLVFSHVKNIFRKRPRWSFSQWCCHTKEALGTGTKRPKQFSSPLVSNNAQMHRLCLSDTSSKVSHLYIYAYMLKTSFTLVNLEQQKKIKTKFSSKITVDFNGTIRYFLGINHTVEHHADGHISVHLSQKAFTDALLLQHLLHHDHISTERSPYKSGLPVNKIKNKDYSPARQQYLTQKFQSIVSSLNWFATSTRSDIAPITNILAKYLSNPSEGHLAHAKHVLRYLKGSKTYGISFSSHNNNNLQSFLKFPIPANQITALTDANWGPQDQSKPDPANIIELELFKTRSLSSYLIWLGSPLHWSAK